MLYSEAGDVANISFSKIYTEAAALSATRRQTHFRAKFWRQFVDIRRRKTGALQAEGECTEMTLADWFIFALMSMKRCLFVYGKINGLALNWKLNSTKKQDIYVIRERVKHGSMAMW